MTESTPKADSPAASNTGAADQPLDASAPIDAASPHASSANLLHPTPPPKTSAASPAPIKYEDPSSSSSAGLVATHSAPAHGAPVRQYLNEFVTPYLLEGMKRLAREQPSNPLEVLGKFLMEKSLQVEGNARDTRMGDVD